MPDEGVRVKVRTERGGFYGWFVGLDPYVLYEGKEPMARVKLDEPRTLAGSIVEEVLVRFTDVEVVNE